MKRCFPHLFLLALAMSVTIVTLATAQKGPQDSLALETAWNHGLNVTINTERQRRGIAVDASNRVWIANGSGVFVYDGINGGPAITNWPVSNATSCRYDAASNLVWICSNQSSSPQMRAYDINFNLAKQWGTNAITPFGFDIAGDRTFYIGSSGIWGFSENGAYRSYFSTPAIVNPITYDVAVGVDGSLFAGSGNVFSRFTTNGTVLASYSSGGFAYSCTIIAVAPDGLVLSSANNLYNRDVYLWDYDLSWRSQYQGVELGSILAVWKRRC